MALYQCLLLGAPTDRQVEVLSAILEDCLDIFGMQRDVHYAIHRGIVPTFNETAPTVAVFFGAEGAEYPEEEELRKLCVPVVPIISSLARAAMELPESLRNVNALVCDSTDRMLRRAATVSLQCLGLLPAQRRVFVSYHRDESSNAALQLYEALSARQFDVFLDTHSVAVAADFQSALWHRLCDSDVLIMLDTPGYFRRRWTTAEWGRAIAKGIAILQLVWPDHEPLRISRLATPFWLTRSHFKSAGHLTPDALDAIAFELERVRAAGIALRHSNLVGTLRCAVEDLGGSFEGVGQGRSVTLRLRSGMPLVVFPVVGVPTAIDVQNCIDLSYSNPSAVVYDHLGISDEWSRHIDWLATHVNSVKFLKSRETCWLLASMEV